MKRKLLRAAKDRLNYVMPDNRIPKGLIVMVFFSGAVCLCWHLLGCHAVERARSWPSIDAVVSHSEVSTSSEIHYGFKTGNRVINHADLVFAFAYTVGDRRYTSTNFYAWGHPPVFWTAIDYPIGQHFKARYNPSDPAEAVVAPGNISQVYLVSSLVLFGLGALCLLYNFYQRGPVA